MLGELKERSLDGDANANAVDENINIEIIT
jgi:hypothetical protein